MKNVRTPQGGFFDLHCRYTCWNTISNRTHFLAHPVYTGAYETDSDTYTGEVRGHFTYCKLVILRLAAPSLFV